MMKQLFDEIFDEWAAAVRAEEINGISANHSPDMLMFERACESWKIHGRSTPNLRELTSRMWNMVVETIVEA